EAELLDTCKELGITFVAYSPLGRGFLTGAIASPDQLEANHFRKHNPRFLGENFDKNLELVRIVRAMASDRKITPAQLALAWVLHRGDQIVAIPGTTKRARVDENEAANDVRLSAAEIAFLDENVPSAVGGRY